MKTEELLETLKPHLVIGNCFNTDVRDTLINYKNSGGQKELVQRALEQLKLDNEGNENIQNSVDDILDIVTGWCSHDMRVWD